jgi:hypothetical protein
VSGLPPLVEELMSLKELEPLSFRGYFTYELGPDDSVRHGESLWVCPQSAKDKVNEEDYDRRIFERGEADMLEPVNPFASTKAPKPLAVLLGERVLWPGLVSELDAFASCWIGRLAQNITTGQRDRLRINTQALILTAPGGVVSENIHLMVNDPTQTLAIFQHGTRLFPDFGLQAGLPAAIEADFSAGAEKMFAGLDEWLSAVGQTYFGRI